MRKKFSPWPFLIVGLLMAHALGMITVVAITQRNKPPVVDNYYEKAINWDKDHANRGK